MLADFQMEVTIVWIFQIHNDDDDDDDGNEYDGDDDGNE